MALPAFELGLDLSGAGGAGDGAALHRLLQVEHLHDVGFEGPVDDPVFGGGEVGEGGY